MPNAYTAPIHEGQDIDFRDFILRCARGFGFALMQRDDPADEPLKTRYEPDTRYHDEKLAAAWKTLEAADALTDDQLAIRAQEEYDAQFRAHEEATEKNDAEIERYDAMIARTEAWIVPDELEEMKATVLQWLYESKDWDTARVYPEPPEAVLTPAALREQRREAALSDIAYHSKNRDEEIERTAERNRYIELLLASLPTETSDPS